MIDNYLLEYLVVFAHTGTIGAVAEKLNVTQPTVSRGLQKIENLLNVKLFERQPQKITLTSSGLYAAQTAERLLKQHRNFTDAVQNFDKKNHQLRLGATIIDPLLLIKDTAKTIATPQLIIDQQLLTENSWQDELLQHKYSLIFTTQEIQTDQIESYYVGTEKLAIKLTKFNALYPHDSVRFEELNGHEFIVSDNIGVWKTIIEQEIPHAHFLYQPGRGSLSELVRYSNFPIFKTNISIFLDRKKNGHADQKRKLIPVSNPQAHLAIYAAYLKSDRQAVDSLIKQAAKLFDGLT